MPNFNNINQHILTFQYIQATLDIYIYAHINIILSYLFKCVKHINNLILIQVRQYFVQCSCSLRQFLHLDCDRWTELIRKHAPAEYRVGSGLCAAEAERFRNAEPPRAPVMAEENGACSGEMCEFGWRCERVTTDGDFLCLPAVCFCRFQYSKRSNLRGYIMYYPQQPCFLSLG